MRLRQQRPKPGEVVDSRYLLCATLVLFLVSLIFYLIASIEYELYFKED